MEFILVHGNHLVATGFLVPEQTTIESVERNWSFLILQLCFHLADVLVAFAMDDVQVPQWIDGLDRLLVMRLTLLDGCLYERLRQPGPLERSL